MVVDSNKIVLAPYVWILASMLMEEAYVQHFKTKLVQRHRSPLQKGDHPELDTTPFLNDKEKEIYMSLVGSA